MSEKSQMNVVKVTMPTKRVAYLKELKIYHTQLAAKAAGKKANNLEAGIAVQNELLKILLVQIDETKLDHISKNNLDDVLSVIEYRCLLRVIEQMSGDDEAGESPAVEMATL